MPRPRDRSAPTPTLLWLLAAALVFAACGDTDGTNSGPDTATQHDTDGQNDTGMQHDAGGPEPGELARGPFPTPGVLTRLEVTGPDGSPQSNFGIRHPVDIAVDVDPADGWRDRLISHPNLHVGLVERVEEDEERDEARSCYLGSLTGKGTTGGVLENGKIRFSQQYFIPKHCLADTDSGTFNVWVALNPARRLPGESFDIPEEDFNTQFFNPLFDDTEDEGRNEKCTGANGEAGCIYNLAVDYIEGFNVAAGETALSSGVFIFNPAFCDSAEENFENPLGNVQTGLTLAGTSRAFENVAREFAQNALPSTGTDEISIDYELCPRGSDGQCADGHDYQSAAVGSPAPDSGSSTLVNSVGVDSLSIGNRREARAALYIEPGPLCTSLAGWSQPDWSAYRVFNLRTCVSPGFDETAPGSDPAADNCSITTIRMVPIDETPGGGGQQSGVQFDSSWEESRGNEVLGAYAGFGSENRLNFDGARNRTFAEAGIDGWFDLALLDASVDARSLTDAAGSGVTGHLDVVEVRQWSIQDGSANQSIEDGIEYAKEACLGYTYGVAGVGLNATLCAEGRAGIDLSVGLSDEQGAGSSPFDSASRRGSVDNELKPHGGFDLAATATLDLVLAKGGMSGTVNLLSAELPIGSQLRWGEVSGPAMVVTWEAGTDLVIRMLDGHIDTFVDLATPGWCDCGTFCGYPCRDWKNVHDERLVSFAGQQHRFPLLSEQNTSGVTLTR